MFIALSAAVLKYIYKIIGHVFFVDKIYYVFYEKVTSIRFYRSSDIPFVCIIHLLINYRRPYLPFLFSNNKKTRDNPSNSRLANNI